MSDMDEEDQGVDLEDYLEHEGEDKPDCFGDYACGSEMCDFCEWRELCSMEASK